MRSSKKFENASMDELFSAYLDDVINGKVGGNSSSRDVDIEKDAYGKMTSEIGDETEDEIKQFMQDTLTYYCRDRTMLLSYIYDNVWGTRIKERRNLLELIQPKGLYIDLVSILTQCCDTTGYTGPMETTKFPLTIPGSWDSDTKIRNISPDVSRVGLLHSYLKLGVHKFRTGLAIKEIINHLQERYGIDFCELERTRLHAGNEDATS